MKKGIILAGGKGSRLFPITKIISKQLLPLYNKPMIYYPLSVLMLSGIDDVLIISTRNQIPLYKKIFNDGKNLGIKISYKIQKKPNGIAEAIKIGSNFVKKKKFTLILGDNFFYGNDLSNILIDSSKKKGASIFLYKVNDPSKYGVAKIKKNKVIDIIEKPKDFVSNYAVTGLYIYDYKALNYLKHLKKSSRGELEITDLNKKYIDDNCINYKILNRGFAWLDNGTFDDYLKTQNFISMIENRQGIMIGCLEEIALNKKFITKKKLINNIKKNKIFCNKDYLLKIIDEKN
jgi:glucose-1-phosphate thymidylyltransferase